jgi:hypothetical protein
MEHSNTAAVRINVPDARMNKKQLRRIKIDANTNPQQVETRSITASRTEAKAVTAA